MRALWRVSLRFESCDHGEIREWLGDYDAETIDEARIKYALGRIANRKPGGRARTGAEIARD